MKRNKYIVGILASFVALCTTSCEDFLESKNPNSLAGEDYYNSLTETNATLASTYATLYDEDLLSIIPGALVSDMGFPREDRLDIDESSRLRLYTHSYTYSESELNNKWEITYQGIFRANQVIKELEARPDNVKYNSEGEPNEDYFSQLCQARYLRGLFYFFLHTTYNRGSVPIHKSVPEKLEDFYKSCEHPDSVRKFYRDDLEFALEHWPTTDNAGKVHLETEKGAASYEAVATTLGISYMYSATEDMNGSLTKQGKQINMTDLDKAIEYLKGIVIDSGKYSLADYEDMFTSATGDFTSESILEINYVTGEKPEETWGSSQKTTNYLGRTREVTYFTLPTWIVYAYEHEEMDPNNEDNYIQRFDINPSAGNSYFYRSLNNVPRRCSQMILSARDHYQPYYLHPSSTEKLNPSETKGVGFYRKYTNWDIVDDEDKAGDGDDKSGKNVVINRLSEVYLLYAEAMIYKGEINEALYYMNKIRARWGLMLLGTKSQAMNELTSKLDSSFDGKSYTAESLLTQLQDIDKPLELSTEGHFIRFIDLRRWGIMGDRFLKLHQMNGFRTQYLQKTIYDATEREKAKKEGEMYSPDTKVQTSAQKAFTILINDDDAVDGYISDNPWETKWIDRINEVGRQASIGEDDMNRGLNNDYYFMEGYESGMSTFDNEKDSYWPIPSDEKNYNPNINETGYVTLQ